MFFHRGNEDGVGKLGGGGGGQVNAARWYKRQRPFASSCADWICQLIADEG